MWNTSDKPVNKMDNDEHGTMEDMLPIKQVENQIYKTWRLMHKRQARQYKNLFIKEKT